MSDEEKKESILKQSGPLSIPREILEAATPVQTQILVTLTQQNLTRERTNQIIFGKLDEAASLARDAKQAAELAKETAETSHTQTMGIKTQINDKFTQLNGTILETKARVDVLEKKNQETESEAITAAVASQAVQAVTKGVWMIPVPSWQTLAAAGSVIAGAVTFVGTG